MNQPTKAITASEDGSVRIWGLGTEKIGGPLLVLDSIFLFGNFTIAEFLRKELLPKRDLTGTKSENQKAKIPLAAIKQARFYYLDKFILLASGPKLCLFKYLLGDQNDDLNRYIFLFFYILLRAYFEVDFVG